MPSISQAKLTELDEERSRLQEERDSWQRDATRAEDRVRKFDAILDKVVRAAQGRSLVDDRNGFQGGYGAPYMSSELIGNLPKLKTVERQEQEIRSLNERIVNLEVRLAATVAVATFAKAHKG